MSIVFLEGLFQFLPLQVITCLVWKGRNGKSGWEASVCFLVLFWYHWAIGSNQGNCWLCIVYAGSWHLLLPPWQRVQFPSRSPNGKLIYNELRWFPRWSLSLHSPSLGVCVSDRTWTGFFVLLTRMVMMILMMVRSRVKMLMITCCLWHLVSSCAVRSDAEDTFHDNRSDKHEDAHSDHWGRVTNVHCWFPSAQRNTCRHIFTTREPQTATS